MKTAMLNPDVHTFLASVEDAAEQVGLCVDPSYMIFNTSETIKAKARGNLKQVEDFKYLGYWGSIISKRA